MNDMKKGNKSIGNNHFTHHLYIKYLVSFNSQLMYFYYKIIHIHKNYFVNHTFPGFLISAFTTVHAPLEYLFLYILIH